jgi:hypothetical protein
VLKRKIKICAQPALWSTDVIPRATELVANHGLVCCERLDGVGELNLSARAVLRSFKRLKDLWAQHITAHDRQVGWGICRFGLLNEAAEWNCSTTIG